MARTTKAVVGWAVAISCILVAVAILLTLLGILFTAKVVQPHAPTFTVREATLLVMSYDELAMRDVQVAMTIDAHNEHGGSSATYTRMNMRLVFAGALISSFGVDPFTVAARGTLAMTFLASARDEPLDDAGRASLDAALRTGKISFRVEGESRTTFKFGLIKITEWTRLGCAIDMFVPNGSGTTTEALACSSKDKIL